MKLIVLITVMGLLVLGVVSVSATVVEVIYEEPIGWSPFGHSAIRIGDKVYDVNDQGEGTGKVHIRERDWEDVLNDERGQQTAEVAMTDELKQQLKENIESEVGSKYDFNPLTNNCADWVEDKLRKIGVNIPDDSPNCPADTLQQVLDLPPIVNGEEEITGVAESQGNEGTIDLGKVASSYVDAFKGVTLSFDLPDQYTLSGEEKSDDCIKLYIQGPEVKAVGDEAWPGTKENVVIYYQDSFYIEIKIKNYRIYPVKPLTIEELSDYDRSPWGILVDGDCGGTFPETKITRISGHDAEYGMKRTYSYAKILTGGLTYVSVTYCGSPYADSKGYRYRQITTDKGEFWIKSATIDDQRPEDRYLSDTKAITESIRINGWAFDKTIIVQGEPLKYFDVTIKPENEAMLNKVKQCGGKVLWTEDEISKGEKKFNLRIYQMGVYDGNGRLLRNKPFEVTRESTRCPRGLSDTIGDPHGDKAIAPSGIYYGRLDEHRSYKRVILSDKKGKRDLKTPKGTTRGGIQIHGVYHKMGKGMWGCLGVPGNDYNNFIDLFKKEDTIWVELLHPSFNEPQESQIRTEISREGKEWNNKGDALYKSGDYENAIKAYDKAIEIDPMNYVAWHSKGSAFYQLGKYKEAVESYSRTLEKNPYDMEAWYGKGISLYELGEYNKAVEAFDKVLEIDPENKKALESRKNVSGLIKNPFREHEEEEIRGFEVIFAIAGLLTVAYLLRGRK